MAASLFFPLDTIQPSQVLAQYSEWIYFTLMLVFFISVSGGVKPLIIETQRNSLPGEERRDRITRILDRIAKDESIFKKNVTNTR